MHEGKTGIQDLVDPCFVVIRAGMAMLRLEMFSVLHSL